MPDNIKKLCWICISSAVIDRAVVTLSWGITVRQRRFITVCHERWRRRQRCCVEDGSVASRSRPAGAGFKLLHAAAFKRRGGERWRKGGGRRRQVRDEKMSESKPLKTHRKGFETLSKRARGSSVRKSVAGTCLRAPRQPLDRRHELIAGFTAERGNLAWDAKGNPQAGPTVRENTKAHGMGGVPRSSDEASVMDAERRGHVAQSGIMRQPDQSGGAR